MKNGAQTGSSFGAPFCCSEQEKDSVIEAFKSEGIKITKIDSVNAMKLDGTKPNSFYSLDNGEQLVVYDFDSKEKQELGLKISKNSERFTVALNRQFIRQTSTLLFYTAV
jgi:hypothetical protein